MGLAMANPHPHPNRDPNPNLTLTLTLPLTPHLGGLMMSVCTGSRGSLALWPYVNDLVRVRIRVRSG